MKKSEAYLTRFPHTCKVYRVEEESPFEDGKETLFFEGNCNVYSSTSLRTFKQNGVIKGEYAVDIPTLVRGVNSGDLLDFVDYNGTYLACVVTHSMPVVYGKREGTTIYFNLPKN